MEFNEKHHWLFTISQITNTYKCAFKLLTEGNEENDKMKGMVITSYMNIQLSSLLSEWSYKFSDAKATDIAKFKIRLQPLIDELRSFKDIKYARNTIFAHNRDYKDENKNTLLSNKMLELTIPVDINDLIFCAYLIEMLHSELQNEFANDFLYIKENSVNSKSISPRFKKLEEIMAAKNVVQAKINPKITEAQTEIST